MAAIDTDKKTTCTECSHLKDHKLAFLLQSAGCTLYKEIHLDSNVLV